MPFARITLSDENAKARGRRTVYLEAKSFDGPTITGMVVARDGSLVEGVGKTDDGTPTVTREAYVLLREDIKKIEPLVMSLKYGELMRFQDLPADDRARELARGEQRER